jgi:hypothetical protein
VFAENRDQTGFGAILSNSRFDSGTHFYDKAVLGQRAGSRSNPPRPE